VARRVQNLEGPDDAMRNLLELVAFPSRGRIRGRKTQLAFERDVSALAASGRGELVPVSEAALEPLPTAVQRYLRFMRVPGRPRDWSLRMSLQGRFRLAPTASWRRIRAWQYDTRVEITRLFYMQLDWMPGIPLIGRDTYRAGRGRLLVRPWDLFTVEDTTGSELDLGELVTYLNDAILFAPSLVLGPETTWSPAGDDAFIVSLRDSGHTVTAQVTLDEQGAPACFTTSDRFVQDLNDSRHSFVRCRWSTPVSGWQSLQTRPIPRAGKAVWHLPQGDFCYAEFAFDPEQVHFNVHPAPS